MLFRESVSVPWTKGGATGAGPAMSTLPMLTAADAAAIEALDVCIVGGGIVGLTTAYTLAQAGKSVCLLEAHTLGGGETSRSTAHLTHVFDTAADELIRKFGRDDAKLVWDGLAFAITRIESIVAAEQLDCGFARIPGYLVATDAAQGERLSGIGAAAEQLGYPAVAASPPQLPGQVSPPWAALAFADQARLHPWRYARGLARQLQRLGVRAFEHTPVVDVSGTQPHTIRTAAGVELTAAQVIIAAHVPFNNRVVLHTKQAAYRSYAVGLRVPRGHFPDVLLWDLEDPYHYVRLVPAGPGERDDLVVVGGEDHKTGRSPRTEDPFAALAAFARRHLNLEGEVVHRWSGQIMEPVDGLPLIGENPGTEGEFVATGLSGDGITGGTLAAHILAERVLGRSTAWDAVFNPSRRVVTHGVRDFIAENVDFPAHLALDRLRPDDTERPVASLHRGEGGLFKLGDRRLAVSRLENGHFAAVEPACSHLGCHVHWNAVEASWDCPCHGSRFAPEGVVLNGPAAKPLTAVPLEAVLTEDAETTARTTAKAPELGGVDDWVAT